MKGTPISGVSGNNFIIRSLSLLSEPVVPMKKFFPPRPDSSRLRTQSIVPSSPSFILLDRYVEPIPHNSSAPSKASVTVGTNFFRAIAQIIEHELSLALSDLGLTIS